MDAEPAPAKVDPANNMAALLLGLERLALSRDELVLCCAKLLVLKCDELLRVEVQEVPPRSSLMHQEALASLTGGLVTTRELKANRCLLPGWP